MKIITMGLFLVLFCSCKKNETMSMIYEDQILSGAELSRAEEMKKAYLEADYDSLTRMIDAGVDVDIIFSDGKNLLYMAVDSLSFRMVDYLVGKGGRS